MFYLFFCFICALKISSCLPLSALTPYILAVQMANIRARTITLPPSFLTGGMVWFCSQSSLIPLQSGRSYVVLSFSKFFFLSELRKLSKIFFFSLNLEFLLLGHISCLHLQINGLYLTSLTCRMCSLTIILLAWLLILVTLPGFFLFKNLLMFLRQDCIESNYRLLPLHQHLIGKHLEFIMCEIMREQANSRNDPRNDSQLSSYTRV